MLLLLVLGGTLYWQFDNIVRHSLFQAMAGKVEAMRAWWMRPAVPESGALPGPSMLWRADSAYLEAECPVAAIDACFSRLDSVQAGLGIACRAWMHRAKAWQPRSAPPLSGVAFRIAWQHSTKRRMAYAQAFRLQYPGGESVYRRQGSDFCNPEGHCLAAKPRPPLRDFHRSPPAVKEGQMAMAHGLLLASDVHQAVFPILPGKVVDLGADGLFRLKIYHGKGIFSYYGGLAQLQPELKTGVLVRFGDTLGLIEPVAGGKGSLSLGVERDGLALDAAAFLGLSPQASERYAHQRP